MRPIVVLVFALLQALLATPVAAQDFRWFSDSYLDPDPFQSIVTLTYGIPQTDAVQFTAFCQIGAGGTYATVQIGADIGNWRDGTDVDLRLTGNRFNQVVLATTFGQNAEVGVTGVEFPVELDDPLWLALSSLSELQYSVEDGRALVLPLRGSSAPVDQFLADCADPVSAGEGPSGPGAEEFAGLPTGQSLSCDLYGQLVSQSDGGPTSVEFINGSDGIRFVMWLDFAGNPVEYAMLEQGQSYVQETAFGHPWMITDGPGNCLEIYLPTRRHSTFVISAPNRNFGAE